MAGNQNSGRNKIPTALKILRNTYRADRDGVIVDTTKHKLSELPDPTTDLFEDDFDELALRWYNFMGLCCIEYGVLEVVDIAQLALCAQLFSKSQSCSIRAKKYLKKLDALETEYDNAKLMCSSDQDMKWLDQLLKEQNNIRQLYKVMLAQGNDTRKQANSLASSFGLNPADRHRILQAVTKPADAPKPPETPDGDSMDDLL